MLKYKQASSTKNNNILFIIYYYLNYEICQMQKQCATKKNTYEQYTYTLTIFVAFSFFSYFSNLYIYFCFAIPIPCRDTNIKPYTHSKETSFSTLKRTGQEFLFCFFLSFLECLSSPSINSQRLKCLADIVNFWLVI
jgi:hypothetical protein